MRLRSRHNAHWFRDKFKFRTLTTHLSVVDSRFFFLFESASTQTRLPRCIISDMFFFLLYVLCILLVASRIRNSADFYPLDHKTALRSRANWLASLPWPTVRRYKLLWCPVTACPLGRNAQSIL